MISNRRSFAITFQLISVTLLASFARADSQPPGPDLRQRINLNRDWKFYLGDEPGAERPVFDDGGWDSVGLPHSFSIPYFMSKDFYVGYGWYRRHLEVPASDAGKRLFIEFLGAFQETQVFVNGKPVGEHQGGYTGFSFDITDAIKPGDNLLAVRVNNLWNPRLAPRAGEHVFSGGIYRDVYFVVTNPLHVPWFGTFVTTPMVSKDSATLSVETEIKNDGAAERQCSVRTGVIDADGKLVTSMRSVLAAPAGETITFKQTSDAIANPRLWDPSHPNLYTVRTTVYDGDIAVDSYDSPLGFRWFKWTADQGFFLNGSHDYFHGADAHQDHAGWGDAVTDAGVWRDVNLVKEAGFDFIRGSHYPHHPVFADACDKLGVLFWSENCFWGTGGFKQDSYWNASAYPLEAADQPGFEESVKRQLTEEIRIFRNHPSIVVWSMSNEPFFTDKASLPKVQNLLKNLVALSHQLDPTRPAAIGGCQRGGIDKLGDVAGYNGDGARLFMNPGIPSVVTEYGSVRAVRPGKYDPGWGDLSKAKGLDATLTYPWEFPWRSGQAVWCCFDHGSIAGAEGQTGIVDYFRLPKRAWYWYRDALAKIPPPPWPQPGVAASLRLTADKTNISSADGTDDVQLIVTVLDAAGKPISNSPPVQLGVMSGPGEFPTGPTIDFDANTDIPIRDGQAAIEFRSYFAGPSVIRATSAGLKSADLTITTAGSPLFVDGKSPVVKARPNVRFARAVATATDEQFGRDKPTRASTEAPGHSGRFANDGDTATTWLAAPDDHSPWWQVDLERLCILSSVNLTLPSGGDYRFKIEVSDDGLTWRTAADQTQVSNTDQRRTIQLPNGSRGQFVRLTFTAVPNGAAAGISEFEITGRLNAP